MKKAILLSAIIFLTGSIWAQSDTSAITKSVDNYVILDLNAGYSIPLGEYASSEDTEESGYASGGYFIDLGVILQGKHLIGFGISYCFQQNSIQPGAYNDTLVGSYEALGSTPWNNNYLLLGPVLNYQTGKFSIIAKTEVGGILSGSSHFTMWEPETLVKSEGFGTGLAVQFLTKLSYQLTKKIDLNFNVSYLGGNPSRKEEFYVYRSVWDADSMSWVDKYYRVKIDRKQKISTINIGVGVCIKL